MTTDVWGEIETAIRTNLATIWQYEGPTLNETKRIAAKYRVTVQDVWAMASAAHRHGEYPRPKPATADPEPDDVTPKDTPMGSIDVHIPLTPAAVAEAAGLMSDLAAGPATPGDSRRLCDQALAAIAGILDTAQPEPVAAQARRALAELERLQDVIRDQALNEALVAELAVLKARVAEIEQALEPQPATDDSAEAAA